MDENGKTIGIKNSPAFDNGTALEYSVKEENFHKYQQEMKIKAHLENPKRAKHHMKWAMEDKNPLNYYDFMAKFVLQYPDSKAIIPECLCLKRKGVEEALYPLCDIVDDSKYKLTPQTK